MVTTDTNAKRGWKLSVCGFQEQGKRSIKDYWDETMRRGKGLSESGNEMEDKKGKFIFAFPRQISWVELVR
jgi:hypothetical protein